MTDQLGKSALRLDARDKVAGTAIYPGDRTFGDELWMKVLFARRPHARVRAINMRAAEALPGVVAVLTARDVPHNAFGLQIADQPVLCGPESDVPGADIVRFIGDKVAVIVAETEAIAAQARNLIQVDYEDLPLVDDPVAAMQPGAPQLHADRPNNVAEYKRIRKGDADSAWTHCDAIVEGVYHAPFQEHAYLQPEAGTAYFDEAGRITVRCAGQWTWEDQQQIAHALKLPPERVRVVYDAIGGAFGGREDMSVQIILALAVYRLRERGVQRPIKIVWTREESIIGHCKRHPMTIKSKLGAKQDGTLLAAEIEIVADGGAYMYTSNKVLGNAVLSATGPYDIPNVKLDAHAVYTNNLVSGAFRGFGAPQGHFAGETQINKLAEALGMDPVALRLKNVLDNQRLTSTSTRIHGGVSLRQVITSAADAGHWTMPDVALRPKPGRFVSGRGFAAAYKNIGFSFGYQENSWAGVELRGRDTIELAIVRIAGAEVGQGHHTVMAQLAAHALGLRLDQIKMEVSDTAFTQSSGSASASRLTFMAGNAVRDAATAALKKWAEEERPAIAEATWLAPKTTPLDEVTGEGAPNFAYGYVAQMAQVTVDTETGAIVVNQLLCADDVGRAINPQQIVGQIEGAVVQAHGYTLLEDFRVKDGKALTAAFSTYLIPGVYDIPERVDSILIEEPHPDGPYGARGVAEMPLIPYAPAVIAAVHDATGVWFDSFPLTPERVLRGLGRF